MNRNRPASRRRSKSINWPRAARSLHAVLRRRRIARVEIACEIGPEGSGILFMHATSTTGRRVSLERFARVFLHDDTPTAYCTLREALEDFVWSS